MRRSEPIRTVVTRRLPEPVEARMAELFDSELNRDDRAMTPAALAEAMRRCDVLVPTLTDRIDGALIDGAGDGLRLIASFGAGTDHIDLAAARERGITVTNTPGTLTEDTADLVMALVLMTMRGFGSGERRVRAVEWTGWAPTNLLGRSATGKALGIVGMGRIGRALAARARAFGMTIHYHNRRRLGPGLERGARYWPALDDMLAEVDVLSLNSPYSAATHHLIDRRRLSLMKRGSYLINAARGAIVDQDGLVEALESGALAGAGLDVYPEEPIVDPQLLALDNVVLLPHLGSATIETRVAMGEQVIANILAWAAGEEPPDRVA